MRNDSSQDSLWKRTLRFCAVAAALAGIYGVVTGATIQRMNRDGQPINHSCVSGWNQWVGNGPTVRPRGIRETDVARACAAATSRRQRLSVMAAVLAVLLFAATFLRRRSVSTSKGTSTPARKGAMFTGGNAET